MAPISKKQVIKNDAIKAPLELAENFAVADKEVKKLLDSLSKMVDVGKKVDANLDIAKNTKAVKEEVDDLTRSQIELEKVDKRIATAQLKQSKEFIKKERQLKDIRKEIKRLIDEEEVLVGTEEKLIRSNKLLLAERRKINAETAEGAARIAEINSEIDANNEAIKGNSSELEQLRFNIGNYRDSLQLLTVQLFEASKTEGGMKALFKTTSQGIRSTTRSALAFIATPLGAVLAALVAGIAAFTAVINHNQAAGDSFRKVWEATSSVMDEAYSRLIRLISAFSILAQGDFGKFLDEAANSFSGLEEAARKAVQEAVELVNLQIALEEATISATTATASLNGEIEHFNSIADDATRSFKEREQAATLANQAEIELAQLNIDMANRHLDIIDLQVEQEIRRGSITRELLQEQADAVANLIEAENAAIAAELANEKVRRELKQDRLERDLDILIDGFDNIKTINERIITSDRQTIRARAENLENLAQLSDDSFNKQIETIRRFTKVSFDENELLAEQDAVVLNQRIRNLGLSEIIEGRLLEVIRERRTVLADLGELEQQLQTASIARLEEIAGNEQELTDDRINALFELADIRLSILDDQLSKGLLNEQEYNDKVIEINQNAADEINKINLSRFDENFSLDQLEAETERLNQLTELNNQFNNGEIDSLKDFEKQKLDIQAEARRKSLNEELSFLEERKSLLENAGIDTTRIDKEIASVRLAIAESSNEDLVNKESELHKALNELKAVAFDASLEIVNNFNDKANARREEQLERIEEDEARELGLIEEASQRQGESDEAFAARQLAVEERKAEVTEEFARRREEVENAQKRADRRRAIFEKILAASQVGINTALAISKAVASSPLTGGLPFSAIAAGIGAVQLAAVLTKPIPAFAKGTKSAPRGYAWINELGPEMITELDGTKKIINTDGPTLTYLKGGERIDTFEYTNRILQSGVSEKPLVKEVSYMPEISRKMDSGFKKIVKAIYATAPREKSNLDDELRRAESWAKMLKDDYK